MGKTARRAASIASIGLLACSMAYADGACLLTPAELEAATGRAFSEGEADKNPVNGSPLCHYTEKADPKRKLTIEVSTSTKAQQQFESRMRLVQSSNKSIALDGVGDRAYYSGSAAGVVSGNHLITISRLRRPSDPQVAPEKVAALLQAALNKAK